MYCKAKEQLLRKKLHPELKNSIPSEDTFQRIFAIINPKELEKCFVSWAKSINPDINREIISVDGKTLCGSRTDDHSVIHMLSAWANEAGLMLGQLRVDEKSNEIPAVPELLDLIDAHGCIITSDAMSCQKKSVIRHIAMNLYKSHKVPKLSVKSKCFRCSFDDDFLCDVILHNFSV